MPGPLTALAPRQSNRGTPLWFDSLAYCRTVLLGGQSVPWGAPGELANFFAKAQGMFGGDAVLVDLGDAYDQIAAIDQGLRAAMAARSRPGYALRTLLAHEPSRALAVEAVFSIRAVIREPVVVSVPSPARWFQIAADAAGAENGRPEPAGVEAAAMYVADLLRILAHAGVDALVLDEGITTAESLPDLDGYRAVVNIADHYDWPVLLRTDSAACWSGPPVEGIAAWLGRPASEGAPPWGEVAELGRADAMRAVGGAPAVAVVPAAADADVVMAHVTAWRTDVRDRRHGH